MTTTERSSTGPRRQHRRGAELFLRAHQRRPVLRHRDREPLRQVPRHAVDAGRRSRRSSSTSPTRSSAWSCGGCRSSAGSPASSAPGLGAARAGLPGPLALLHVQGVPGRPLQAAVHRRSRREAGLAVRARRDFRPQRRSHARPRYNAGMFSRSSPVTEAAVLDALRVVHDPDLHKDIVSLGFVKRVAIDGGAVGVTIELTTPACPVKDQLRDQAAAAIRGIAGVDRRRRRDDGQRAVGGAARWRPRPDPGHPQHHRRRRRQGRRRQDHRRGQPGASRWPGCGSRVGIIDGDIYGPNVPIMLGVRTQLDATTARRSCRPRSTASSAVSMGFLTNDEAPVIWRGPMLHGVVNQFFRDVRWPELDYLIVDMPPGTGDVALSLSQSVPVAGAVVVTTPQRVSLADTRRAVKMYEKLNAPVLGLIENMSHFVCPGCGREADLFGRGGGEGAGHRDGPAVPRPHPALRAGAVGRRQRRADRHRRARFAARWRWSPPPSASPRGSDRRATIRSRRCAVSRSESGAQSGRGAGSQGARVSIDCRCGCPDAMRRPRLGHS